MKVFLIGFMGCGKTTLGRKLSSRLGYEFIDLDEHFEKTSGLSITEYFEKYGEEKFRASEKEILQHSSFPSNTVVSTGGGAPCFSDNMEWMNNNGLTIYISMSPEALASRLERGKLKRPLIKDFNQEELVLFIRDKLLSREPFYKQASASIDGLADNKENLVVELINRLDGRKSF